jgi:ribosomal protein S18 acetylase RimI-like enzyme
MTYTYRKAEETDKEAIFKLYGLAMSGLISEIWGWNERWQKDDFSACFDPRNITLAHLGEELVGYSHVEHRGDKLFIRMIAVHPAHQGRGIGSKLLESVIASAVEQSTGIELEVFKINAEAKKLYEKYGFAVQGETPASYVMVRA